MTVSKKGIPYDHRDLKCDLCDSENIVDESQGYVCRDCGVVLTVQKLQYDRPYNSDVIQHSIQFGATQIGNVRERANHPQSYQLKRMNKHNSQLSSKEYVENRAATEISRIFDCLSLPNASEVRVREKFSKVFSQLHPGSRYKNPEKLSAILIYMVLKLENIAIKRKDIVDASLLSNEEFNSFILQLRQYIPEYTKRDRQNYVAQKLMKITEHFGLDMSFYFLSRKVLSKLWESVKNTTDDAIAGLCTSITALCEYKGVIKVSSICDLLSVKMSTIQFQVKKRIFERFRLPGFVSLVRSSDLLKSFLEEVGILKGESLEVDVIEEEPCKSEENVISIELGNAHRIFNPHNENYLIECVGDNKTITLYHLEVYNHHNHRGRSSTKKVGDNEGVWFDLTSSEYYPRKGPPLMNLT